MSSTRVLAPGDTADAARTLMSGPWLGLARAAWATVAALNLALLAAGAPVEYAYFVNSGLTEFAPGLRQLGLTAQFYATYRAALDVASAGSFTLVGLVLFWRRPNDWMVMLVSLACMAFGSIYVPIADRLAAAQPALQLPVGLLRALGLALSLVVFYYLLPDGRFVPRWTRWSAALWAVLALSWLLFPDAPENLVSLDTWMDNPALGVGLYAAVYGSGVYAQVYRYRHVSGPVQRQQTKWIVYGTTAALAGFVLYYGPLIVAPSIYQPGVLRLLHVFFMLPVFEALVVAAPVSIAVSVLRYRLWQLDVIVNRTLVYGTLTVLLILFYLRSIMFLQPFFDGLVGQGLDLAVAVTTLLIAATFNPLRRFLQKLVDKRFYRGKYEAALALADFAAMARQEVDVEALSRRLLEVVETTVRPAQVSLLLLPVRREPRSAEPPAGPAKPAGGEVS